MHASGDKFFAMFKAIENAYVSTLKAICFSSAGGIIVNQWYNSLFHCLIPVNMSSIICNWKIQMSKKRREMLNDERCKV